MKILVCISKAPDTTTKIAFNGDGTEFSKDGVTFIINPYDEWYALVSALEIKEAQGGSVTVINVGLAENDQVIRKALAIGADDAVRIDVEAKDAMQAAKNIADYAKDQGYDMILTGKETIDYNGGAMGAILSELLGLAYVPMAAKLVMNGNKATIEREVEGGREVVEVETPFVISAQKGMAEQRIPNMRGIMQARTKPLKVVSATVNAAQSKIVKYKLPEDKGTCTYVDADNPAELWNLLRNEAKVI